MLAGIGRFLQTAAGEQDRAAAQDRDQGDDADRAPQKAIETQRLAHDRLPCPLPSAASAR